MVHRRTETTPARTVEGVRRAALALLVVVVVVGGVPLRARASSGSDDSYSIGNGRHNKNVVENHSPEFNRGIQHITTVNAAGSTAVQASFCKWKFRHCRISQRAFVRAR
jgi:hypothetical protein